MGHVTRELRSPAGAVVRVRVPRYRAPDLEDVEVPAAADFRAQAAQRKAALARRRSR